MFSDAFDFGVSFTQEFNTTASHSNNADDGSSNVTGKGQSRELASGCLHATIPTLISSHLKGDFKDGKTIVFGRLWSIVVVVGWIRDLDESSEEGIWSGDLYDGRGSMQFRYETRSELGRKYLDELEEVKPKDSENLEEGRPPQKPAKLFGHPQDIDGTLCLMTSHIRCAEVEEALATHILESAATLLDTERKTPAESTGGKTRSSESNKMVDHGQSEVENKLPEDPYNDEAIVISDDTVNDLIGTEDRLKRVIYRFLKEAGERAVSTDESESVIAIRSFCRPKWKDDQVVKALDELEDLGVIVSMDSSKTRVCLA